MVMKQLSVFIENREGRLEKVTETITDNGINIVSLSLADTSEYGMLRLIVSDPEKARDVLKAAGFSAKLTDVIAIKLPHEVGMLNKMLRALTPDVNIEYMYTLATDINASIVMKISDIDKAAELFKNAGFTMFDAEDAYRINS